MLNYLYYKLYQATLKGSLRDIPQYVAPIYLGALICANILVVNAFLAKIDIMPFLFFNRTQSTLICIALIIIIILFLIKEEEILYWKYTHKKVTEVGYEEIS